MLFAFFIASTSVLNRKLKEIPTSIIMFYHGLFGLIPIGAYILIEAARSETGMRMMGYSPTMFWGMVASTVFNAISVTCHTIAFQSDRSGFIVVIRNIEVLYFFLSDTFIFHETFTWVEFVGVFVIMVVVIGIAISRAMSKNNENKVKEK